MYCSNCGNPNRPEAKFCRVCGKQFDEIPNNPIPETERLNLQEALYRHQRNLAILESRAANFGLDVPLHIVAQIDEEKKQAEKIQNRLVGVIEEPSLATQYFSTATRALLKGDFWEARRYYRMTLEEDPFYPRAAEQLSEVERQIRRSTSQAAPPMMASDHQKPMARARKGFPLWLLGLIILIIALLVVMAFILLQRNGLLF
jgi:tetratricopeptide (TPR) repeat protein